MIHILTPTVFRFLRRHNLAGLRAYQELQS